MAESPTSIRELRQKLGRTGLLDSNAVRIVRASPNEVPIRPGVTFMGFIEKHGDALAKDKRGRIIIKLTDDTLASLQTAVETIGHELHHIGETLAGSGASEEAADAAGKEYFETFLKRSRRLD